MNIDSQKHTYAFHRTNEIIYYKIRNLLSKWMLQPWHIQIHN